MTPIWHYLMNGENKHFSWPLLIIYVGKVYAKSRRSRSGQAAKPAASTMPFASIAVGRGEHVRLISFTYCNPQEREKVADWSYLLLNPTYI